MPDFSDPWFLVLLPLPFAVRLLLPPRPAAGAALIVPEGVGQRLIGQTRGAGTRLKREWLLPVLIWLALVTALAGPRQLIPSTALPISGRDLILSLDLSGSMVRDDFALDGAAITRLEAVKTVGADFVRRRGGDRIGLVVFGSEAYVAAPPTFDTEAVARSIEGMVIGISGRATNIADGLGIALKRLAGSRAESRVVILLSDGASNAGAARPADVAKLAASMGVRVHTIALGPKSLADAPGERGVVDVATLDTIAGLGGGQMFRVRTTDDLVAVAEAIDRLEPTARAGLVAETYRDFWVYPAILGLVLSLMLGWRSRT